MAAASYDEALRRLLIHEGGYTNHPSDPGGPTNFGITIHDYRKYVKPDAIAADVRAMRAEEAKAIYRARYWDAQRCDELPGGLDYAVFDYGVNSGVGRSGKVLRRLLKLTDASSTVTDDVIAAAQRADAKKLIAALCDERLAFLQRLKTWPVFGKGWGRRVAEVKAAALVMAAASGTAEQSRSQTKAPVTGVAQKSAAGAIAAMGTAAAQQAYQADAELSLVIALAMIGVGVALASWIAWRWWQRRLPKTSAVRVEKSHGLE